MDRRDRLIGDDDVGDVACAECALVWEAEESLRG